MQLSKEAREAIAKGNQRRGAKLPLLDRSEDPVLGEHTLEVVTVTSRRKHTKKMVMLYIVEARVIASPNPEKRPPGSMVAIIRQIDESAETWQIESRGADVAELACALTGLKEVDADDVEEAFSDKSPVKGRRFTANVFANNKGFITSSFQSA